MTKPWRIVIVDDSPDDRADVRRMLLLGSERRFSFVEFERGAEALLHLQDAVTPRPDCLVLDFDLPDMQAPELLTAIADGDGISILPVVVITGSVGRVGGQDVLRAGAQDYIGKDWLTPPALVRAVENAVDRWTMARALRERRIQLEQSQAQSHMLLESVREQEAQLRLALQASHTGIWSWDLVTDRVAWSPECHEIFGLAPPEFGGTADAFFALVHPDDRANVHVSVKAAIESQTLYGYEFRVVRPDGQVIWVENLGCVSCSDTGQPIVNAAGQPIRFLGTVRDVTQRRASEETLRSALRQAELAVLARDQLVLLVSHDLRSPLSVLAMGTETLRTKLADDENLTVPELSSALARMARQVTRMNKLIDELLDVAQMHAGRPLTLDLQEVELVGLVRGLVDDRQHTTRRHRIEVRTQAPALRVRWDAKRIERVVDNLLSNAIKYSPAGGDVCVELDVSAQADDRVVTLRVQDRGIGINPTDYARIFEWFERGGNTERTAIPGVGIGLASARQIVDAHHGAITVESVEGQGTMFTVRLPFSP